MCRVSVKATDSSQLGISEDPPSELPVFQWIPLHNITSLEECRNSQQGHTLIADELGNHDVVHSVSAYNRGTLKCKFKAFVGRAQQ